MNPFLTQSNALEFGTCVLAAMAPFTAILPSDAWEAYEKWGAGGLFLGVAVLFYMLWNKTTTKLEDEKNKRIADKDKRIAELLHIIDEQRHEVDKLHSLYEKTKKD